MNPYSNRRDKIAKSLKANTAILLFSGVAPMKSQDESYRFSVDRNFYYLSGLEQENMALLMYSIDGSYYEVLFTLPYDELMAKWVGGRILPQKATEISEIKDVRNYDELDSHVSSLMNRMRRDNTFKFYFDMWHYSMDQASTVADQYLRKLKEKYPTVIYKDIFPVLTNMRLHKDDYEISCMKKAIHITNQGIAQMMKAVKPGMNEMEMEGVFDFVLMQSMCREKAFNTIAASGERATILHYSDNNQVMEDGELFLCDLGASYSHYCADISRTFPVNGKFTERQKEIYNIVLNAQKIVEDNARVGVKLKDLNQMVVDYYKLELPKHGLMNDVSEYYYHSVSHHIGLDTHDCDGGMGSVLEAGNVISNEPGLYIADEGIGIRIEDDLLITGTGCENLSSEIIRTAEDIENFMNMQLV
ncbi:MAG: Xaa-Pro peptidase family protein [Erysipelotrichaceae bacterium]|nr:Xaa-Pro peptidase family protein [Erysipelotrichaceae bacterium]